MTRRAFCDFRRAFRRVTSRVSGSADPTIETAERDGDATRTEATRDIGTATRGMSCWGSSSK